MVRDLPTLDAVQNGPFRHLLARKVDFLEANGSQIQILALGFASKKNDLQVMAKTKRGVAFNSLCGYEYKNISTLRSSLLHPFFGPQSSLLSTRPPE